MFNFIKSTFKAFTRLTLKALKDLILKPQKIAFKCLKCYIFKN